MAKKTFAERVKEVISNQEEYKGLTGGEWYLNHETYNHILKKTEDNFIDKEPPKYCDIKGNLTGKNKTIGYHKGASSLNSSQAMCINFFKKFFDEQGHGKWEEYLLKALIKCNVPISGSTIKNATFEYVKCSEEKTNFDFYMEMDDGSHISMEIKYTESEFGGIKKDKNDPEKYNKKWENIYKEMVKDSLYLKNYNKEFFEKNYQINRNICYAKKERDFVLFIVPKANDGNGIKMGLDYIKNLNEEKIKSIYWEDLVEKLMELVADEPDLIEYYGKFKKKYIDILQEI